MFSRVPLVFMDLESCIFFQTFLSSMVFVVSQLSSELRVCHVHGLLCSEFNGWSPTRHHIDDSEKLQVASARAGEHSNKSLIPNIILIRSEYRPVTISFLFHRSPHPSLESTKDNV
jgi:hypothetical protein